MEVQRKAATGRSTIHADSSWRPHLGEPFAYGRVLCEAIGYEQSSMHNKMVAKYIGVRDEGLLYETADFRPAELPPHAELVGWASNTTTPSKYLEMLQRMDKERCDTGRTYAPDTHLAGITDFSVGSSGSDEYHPMAQAFSVPVARKYAGVSFKDTNYMLYLSDRMSDPDAPQKKDSELMASPFITQDCPGRDGCHCHREFTFTPKAYESHPLTSPIRRLDNQMTVRSELASLMRSSKKNTKHYQEYLMRMMDPKTPKLRFVSLPFGLVEEQGEPMTLVVIKVPVCKWTFHRLFNVTQDYDGRLMSKRKLMGDDPKWMVDEELYASSYRSASTRKHKQHSKGDPWWSFSVSDEDNDCSSNKTMVGDYGFDFAGIAKAGVIPSKEEVASVQQQNKNTTRRCKKCGSVICHCRQNERSSVLVQGRKKPPAMYHASINASGKSYTVRVDTHYIRTFLPKFRTAKGLGHRLNEDGETTLMKPMEALAWVCKLEGVVGFGDTPDQGEPSQASLSTVGTWLHDVMAKTPTEDEIICAHHSSNKEAAPADDRNLWSLDWDKEYAAYFTEHGREHPSKRDPNRYRQDVTLDEYLRLVQRRGLLGAYVQIFNHEPTEDRNKWCCNPLAEYRAYYIATRRHPVPVAGGGRDPAPIEIPIAANTLIETESSPPHTEGVNKCTPETLVDEGTTRNTDETIGRISGSLPEARPLARRKLIVVPETPPVPCILPAGVVPPTPPSEHLERNTVVDTGRNKCAKRENEKQEQWNTPLRKKPRARILKFDTPY